MNTIGLALGGLYSHYNINKILFKLKNEYPECFYDDIIIDAVFGNFQFCIWDGGRIFPQYIHATLENILDIQDYYNNQLKIPMRFIYTNTQIEEHHLYDRFCNQVTEICENELNEIVVNSPILEEYLMKKYPKYNFISSTTKCILDKEKTKELLNDQKYSLVCLDYNLNYNIDFLKSLTPEEKEKCEFLVNAICDANCKNRKQHYDLNSNFSLTYGKKYNLNFCNVNHDHLYPFETMKDPRNQIDYNTIKNIYAPLGFKHFKLEGRTCSKITYLEMCVNYMVKPQYHTFITALTINLLKFDNIEKENI